jgi:glutamate--cysteine ligase
VAGRSVRDVAVDMVAIAKQGLKNRARMSGGMVDERGYLTELEDIADSGLTPADRLLALYHGEWQGDLTRLYRDFAY